MTRGEQLRGAKRRQRERERQAGELEVRVKLPRGLAEKLAFASRQPDFRDTLAEFCSGNVLLVADFPQLQALCWNRRSAYIQARDAWSLIDRNRRFIEPDRLSDSERALLESLDRRFAVTARA
jgi:hypothetical protein